jgi:hypothetical protein
MRRTRLTSSRDLNRLVTNVPSRWRMASIASDGALILPHQANPRRMGFSAPCAHFVGSLTDIHTPFDRQAFLHDFQTLGVLCVALSRSYKCVRLGSAVQPVHGEVTPGCGRRGDRQALKACPWMDDRAPRASRDRSGCLAQRCLAFERHQSSLLSATKGGITRSLSVQELLERAIQGRVSCPIYREGEAVLCRASDAEP